MKTKYYSINGEIKKSNEALISVDDYGLNRGYGIFETIRLKDNKIIQINDHIDRLFKGLSTIKIDFSVINRINLINDVKKIAKINNITDGLIKIIITKGTAIDNNKILPNIYVTIKEMYDIPKSPVKVIFLNESNYPLVRFNPSFKGINYIGNMMALEDAKAENAFECIFLNDEQNITECSMRNIFFIKDEELITPSLSLGILSGTTRSKIETIAKQNNINFINKIINKSEVNTMDEAFICSSAIGILPCYWDEWKSEYTITKKLQFLLEESLQK